jgi:hypothetical protein
MSDRETPAQDDQIDGWRVEWTSRRRLAILGGEVGKLHEPVLKLRKPGRMWIEVKGQEGIDRPCMLAHGMAAAYICDAHFAREWGDEGAAIRYEAEAERWRQIVKVRTSASAVRRVGKGIEGRMLAGTAGAQPQGMG